MNGTKPPKRESRPGRGGDLKEKGKVSGVGSNRIRRSRQAPSTSSLAFRLVSWCPLRWREISWPWFPYPWHVIGRAEIACGDRVVEDILICVWRAKVFALVKWSSAMTEHECGQLADAAIALVREADPESLAGMIDLFGPGT
jgi:hypothetical protein